MGDVVNINRYRKDRDRRARAGRAAVNRVRHGLDGGIKSTLRQETGRRARDLDGKRLDVVSAPVDDDTPPVGQ